MLRFFRTLRQRLLAENRVSRYLLYALGEIALVMIGILLALRVNTWNQQRQDRIEEQKYLLRLEQDLETDLVRIEEVRLNHEIRIILALDVLDSLGPNNGENIRNWPNFEKALDNSVRAGGIPKRNMGENLFTILVSSIMAPARVTFDELLSTGKISLISNDSLRIELQSHYPQIDDIRVFQEAILSDVQRTYRQGMIENHISTLNQKTYREIASGLSDTSELIVTLENYLRLSTVFLNNMYYDPDSHYNNTLKLLERVKSQKEPPIFAP